MRQQHPFLFTSGFWEGEGIITFSMAEDRLPFTTRWTIAPEDEGKISFFQEIFLSDVPEKMHNRFSISGIADHSFQIELENSLIGKVKGVGLLNPKVIAWEFRNTPQGFEGFEIYEFCPEDESYKMRAEFTGGEGYRTYVAANLRKTTN